MHIIASPLQLELARPFRIAHGTSTERTNILVSVRDGLGEAGLPPYLGTDAAAAATWLEGIVLPTWSEDAPPPIQAWLADLPSGPLAARCALDLALHDHWGKRIGQPLFRLFGLDPTRSPITFQTIAIPDRPDQLTRDTVPAGPRLKLKLGSGDLQQDLDIARRIRQISSAQLCIDANGGWSIPEAVSAIPQLAALEVAFIEQPIAAGDPDDWHLLKRLLAPGCPPLVADESARTPEDVIALAGAAEGINVKLAKCGGIAAARTMISLARSLDMKVVLGCMVESSLAITAAAHLAPLADYADLDGADLLRHDPFLGVTFSEGRPVVSDLPGLGVTRRPD